MNQWAKIGWACCRGSVKKTLWGYWGLAEQINSLLRYQGNDRAATLAQDLPTKQMTENDCRMEMRKERLSGLGISLHVL